MRAINDLENLISPKYPKLIERIRQLIEDSERAFSKNKDSKGEDADSFLWEHTIHVAAIARKIALAEEVNTTDAVIAALFHDSGKFEGMDKEKIDTITAALTALYNDKQLASRITDVVHDADFLAKFGYLGVANFFVKSALRGQALCKILISSLSATLSYYQGLLDELREAGIAFFKIIEAAFPCPKNPNKILTLRMAVPEVCPECSGGLSMNFTSQTQTKCEQLTATIHCEQCPSQYEITFCLPEIDQ
jgi:uncharacterized protein